MLFKCRWPFNFSYEYWQDSSIFQIRYSWPLFFSFFWVLILMFHTLMFHIACTVVYYAFPHGTLIFAFHGSFNNHLFQRIWLAVEESTPIRKWLKKLPCRAKPCEVPCERAYKTVSETGVKSDPAFCLGSTIEKTNSVVVVGLFMAQSLWWSRISWSRRWQTLGG